MKLSASGDHLTYCTNIHRGESWADVWHFLQNDVLAVKRAVCPDQPFGVGLRLSGIAVGRGQPARGARRAQELSERKRSTSLPSMPFPTAPSTA